MRVLALDPLSPADRDRFEGLGAESVVEAEAALDRPLGPSGAFDFLHCGALPPDGRQLLVLARLWHAATPNASLLLGSRVLEDAEASRYMGVEAGASGLQWVPGRLALRWMVESSGFDVLRWHAGERAASEAAESFAYLTARRSGRLPALRGQIESSAGDDAVQAPGRGTNGAPAIGLHDEDLHPQRVPS